MRIRDNDNLYTAVVVFASVVIALNIIALVMKVIMTINP